MLKCLKKIDKAKTGIFAAGVLFGTAGIKVLSSKDAKKLYTQCTAAVLRTQRISTQKLSRSTRREQHRQLRSLTAKQKQQSLQMQIPIGPQNFSKLNR